MMVLSTTASFLLLSASVVAAGSATARSLAEDCSSKLTISPNDALESYFDRVPMRNQLIDPSTARASGQALFVLEGQVLGKDCVPIAGALVEMWYAGAPNQLGNTYLMDYRAKWTTDECGFYSFTQTFPVGDQPNVHMIVNSPTGNVILATRVYLQEENPAQDPSWQVDPSITATVDTQADGSRSATFDVYMNAPGNVVDYAAACPQTQDREDDEGSETIIDTIPAPKPPTTQAPATQAPATQAPATQAPATQAPIPTPAPQTPAPATPAPEPQEQEQNVVPPPANFVSGNINCASASTALPVTVMGGTQPLEVPLTTLVGNTEGGQPVAQPSCFGVSSSGPSNWFWVIGTGGPMIASTCHPGTELDTKITIYQGNSCSGLSCVTANDDMGATGRQFGQCEYNSLASRVQWDSVRNMRYYIQAHGFATRTGVYEISVEAHMRNDECAFPAPLNVGDTLVRSTVGAKIPYEGNMARCQNDGGTVGMNRGLWYAVVGTGGRLEANTCDSETKIANKVYLFEGTCEDREEFRYPGPPGPKMRHLDEEDDDEEEEDAGSKPERRKNTIRGRRRNGHGNNRHLQSSGRSRQYKSYNGVNINPDPVDFITHCIGGVHNPAGKPTSCNAIQWNSVAGRMYYILTTSSVYEGDIAITLQAV